MADEPNSSDDSIERSIREYIVNGAAEGAKSAAQLLSEALGVGLNEVLAAVQQLRSSELTSTLTGEESVTVSGSTASVAVTAVAGTVVVSDADVGTGGESFSVVRQADVAELVNQVSRDGRAVKLSDNQWILAAVILIAAVYSLLSHDLQ